MTTGRRLSLQSVSSAVRLTLGVALLVSEGLVREHAQIEVLAAGLSLLALPEAVRFDRWLSRLRTLAVAEAAAEADKAEDQPTR